MYGVSSSPSESCVCVLLSISDAPWSQQLCLRREVSAILRHDSHTDGPLTCWLLALATREMVRERERERESGVSTSLTPHPGAVAYLPPRVQAPLQPVNPTKRQQLHTAPSNPHSSTPPPTEIFPCSGSPDVCQARRTP